MLKSNMINPVFARPFFEKKKAYVKFFFKPLREKRK